MKSFTRTVFGSTLVAASLFLATAAQATLFDFDVEYDGSTFNLDAGSDDPIGALVLAGDSFNYNVQAAGSDFWQVDAGDSFFPFLAFAVAESETRSANFFLNLLLDGVLQYSSGPLSEDNSFVHMGTNSISLTTGLVFDEMVLDYSLLGTTGAGLTTIQTYNFGPDHPGGFSPGISYVRDTDPPSPAPAPATLALVAIALAGLGWSSRRKV